MSAISLSNIVAQTRPHGKSTLLNGALTLGN